MSLLRSTASGPAGRAAPRRRGVASATARDAAWGYFFVAPSLLAFLAFSLYPMLRSILLSFQHFTLRSSEWVGLENYQGLLANPTFYVVLRNTLVYALLIVPLGVVLSITLAGLIFRLPGPAQVFFKSAYYLPVVTSGVVLSLIWLFLYDPAWGLLNYLLGLVGLGPVQWLSDPRTSLPSLVLMYHASHWGGSIILLTASMGGIPEHLYEAARLDGASQLRQALAITIPLLRPALAYVAITGTIASLQVFTEIFLMTNGGPNFATTNLVYFIYERGFIMFDFSMGSAVATILLAITATMALIQFRFFATDVEY
ncbi:MAG TPA: sugar ABC transporter permease [Chloroflexota bacterium]